MSLLFHFPGDPFALRFIEVSACDLWSRGILVLQQRELRSTTTTLLRISEFHVSLESEGDFEAVFFSYLDNSLYVWLRKPQVQFDSNSFSSIQFPLDW